MATILCLETATTNCSVALSLNGSVIVLQEDNSAGYSHAEKLHPYISKVLQKAKIKKEDLTAVAISKGPGSYTGLRIGVSAAKGLAFALNIPLVSIPTLQSFALQVSNRTDFVVAMLDARRMEVYSAVFSNNEQIRETKAEVLSENSFMDYLEKGTVTFIGNGVEKFKVLCSHKNAVYLDKNLPSANEMATIAYSKFQNEDYEDVAYFEPYYLKDFMAGK